MGTLRTLFAIAVVFAHSWGDFLVGGRNAVQLFYMISGFLISYVLVEKRAYPNVMHFYFNRYLRLYPIYFVVACLTLVVFTVSAVVGKSVIFFKIYRDIPFSADFFLTVANITLFFQDWIMFSGIDGGTLIFSTNFARSEVELWKGLLVPQAWTLGLELTFYVLAPFILFKKRIFLSLLIASLMLRGYLIYDGIGMQDPWTYRFFPTELALFLFGALAHQVLYPLYRQEIQPARIGQYALYATAFLIVLTACFSFIPVDKSVKSLLLIVLFFFLLPFTFIFQANRAWDQRIGDLSYPIYISHMLVIYFLNFTVNRLGRKLGIPSEFDPLSQIGFALSVVLFTIGFSILLNRFVGKPIEALRARFRSSAEIGEAASVRS